jgi:4-hydroxybenzoate polyprenyltransferase
MKRITYWPQGWLGIAINFGAVVSWLSLTSDMDYLLMGSLLFSMWSWTILYGQLLIPAIADGLSYIANRYHLCVPGQSG